MSKSGSESSSSTTTQTTTEQYDQRVGAEGGAVALGQGATLSISEQFPQNVAVAFNELINLARDAGELVINSNENLQEATKKALESNEKALQMALEKVTEQSVRAGDLSKSTVEAVTKQLERQEAGSTTIYTDLFPYIAAVIIAIVAIVIFYNTKKR